MEIEQKGRTLTPFNLDWTYSSIFTKFSAREARRPSFNQNGTQGSNFSKVSAREARQAGFNLD